MKTKLLFAALLALFALDVAMASPAPKTAAEGTSASQTAQTCPDGTYRIGDAEDGGPICKSEPTGCPYGDSVPLGAECDKLADQQPNVNEKPKAVNIKHTSVKSCGN